MNLQQESSLSMNQLQQMLEGTASYVENPDQVALSPNYTRSSSYKDKDIQNRSSSIVSNQRKSDLRDYSSEARHRQNQSVLVETASPQGNSSV